MAKLAPDGRPLPRAEGLNRDFYDQLARGSLYFQRCDVCQTWRHPPRFRCGSCGSDRWSWQASSGNGLLHSWTVTHEALHPIFEDRVPYAVVVIELEEGPRLVSHLRGVALDALALDLPVQVALERVSEDYVLHHFEPRR
jgi:uncharacterized OB-fold protein